MATAAKPAPSPSKVDELAKYYLEVKEKHFQATLEVRALQAELEAKGSVLRELAEVHGSVHAEKSKLLHGVGYEIMATFGQMVSVDAAAVEKFRVAASLELSVTKLARVFDVDIRYRLAATAAEFIRTGELSRKVKALYAACTVVKDKTPTLTVREKQPA